MRVLGGKETVGKSVASSQRYRAVISGVRHYDVPCGAKLARKILYIYELFLNMIKLTTSISTVESPTGNQKFGSGMLDTFMP